MRFIRRLATPVVLIALAGCAGTPTPTVTSLTLTGVPASMMVGKAVTLGATATYSDKTTRDVRASAVWASGDDAVVTFSGTKGILQAVAPGTTTVNAIFQGQKASAMITVEGPPAVTVTSISILPTSPRVNVGDTLQLTATATMSDTTTHDVTATGTWTTSDGSLASVSTHGLVTGLSGGTVTISVTSGSVTQAVTLTVVGTTATLTTITITPAHPSLTIGGTAPLHAMGTYSDTNTLDLSAVVAWNSSDTSVLSISSTGVVTGVAAGTATVTATLSQITGTLSVTVTPVVTMTLQLTPMTVTLAPGATQQFTAQLVSSDQSTMDVTHAATWSTSSRSIATVSNASGVQGLATAVANGTATVTALYGGSTATATLTVTTPPPTLVSIAVTPATGSVQVGDTLQYVATGTLSDASTMVLTTGVVWEASNANVASISESGLATGLSVGGADITATVGGIVSPAVPLTVTAIPPHLVSIAITPGNVTVPPGGVQPFVATATYSDGTTPVLSSGVTWASSDTSVAVISGTGRATAVASSGTTNITATVGSITSPPVVLTVGSTTPVLVQLTLSPASSTLHVGGTQQLTLSGLYNNGSTHAVTTGITWTSDTTSVATVNASGLVTAVSVGTSNLVAQVGSIVSQTGSVTVLANIPTLVSLALAPSSVSLTPGDTQLFTATATYDDATTSTITTGLTWASSRTSVASVDTTGLATAVALGDAQITARSGSVTSTAAPVHVAAAPPTLVSIAVTPVTTTAAVGDTRAFQAVGTFSDASTLTLTSGVTWTSSAPSIAVIGNDGTATAIAPGSAQITATSLGVTSNAATLTVPATLVSIALSPASSSITQGLTQQFTATGTYSDATTRNVTGEVTWLSSSTSIATISSTGLATGRAPGMSTITATFSGITSATATLTVNPLPPTLISISVTPGSVSLSPGGTQDFTATATYSDGTTPVISSGVTWVSSNPTVATINSSGHATAVGNSGTTSVTAQFGGVVSLAATLTVVALPPTLVSIALTPASPTIHVGETQQLIATGTLSDSTTQQLTTGLTWTSDTTAAATVSTSGLVSGVGVGTAQITVQSGSIVSAPSTVTVLARVPLLVSISLAPSTATIETGATQAFTATAHFDDASTGPLTTGLTWSSTHPEVATVGTDGMALGIGGGDTEITAQSGAITSDPASLHVNPAPPHLVSIAVTPGAASLLVGAMQVFTATGTLSDATTPVLTTGVTWISSNTTVGTVTSDGTFTALAAGTTQITAASGGVTSPAVTVTVSVPAPILVSIALTPTSSSLFVGGNVTFSATGTYNDAQSATLSGVTWASSNAAVASIDSTGKVSALTSGSTNITATLDGVVSTAATVTVSVPTLVSIALTPTSSSLNVGGTVIFTATGTYNDTHTAVLSSVTWASSSASVASIDGTGKATALSAGATNITATSGRVTSAAAALTVSSATSTLVSLVLTPSRSTIAQAEKQQYSAYGTFQDGSTSLVTNGLTWTSSAAATATVDSSGLVTAVASGTATITAKSGSITATASVTVSGGPLTLVSITLDPGVTTIGVGDTLAFAAYGIYSDHVGRPLTSGVTWASSATAKATVSASGVATAVATGTTSITAKVGSITSTAVILTVASGSATLSSITVSPGAATLIVDAFVKLTATGTYSDGTTRPLSGVTWASDDTTSAIVGSDGVVVGAAGTGGTPANITATVGGVVSADVPISVLVFHSICEPSVNEMQPGVSGAAADEWVELVNPCTTDLDVTGYTLEYLSANAGSNPTLATLTGSIPSGGFYVCGANAYVGQNDCPIGDGLSASSFISSVGGAVAIWDPTHSYISSSVSWGSANNSWVNGTPSPWPSASTTAYRSLIAYPDGQYSGDDSVDFRRTTTLTPGRPNVWTAP